MLNEIINIYQRYYYCHSTNINLDMEFYVNHRTQSSIELGVITFSNVFGILGQTSKVPDLVEKIGHQKGGQADS